MTVDSRVEHDGDQFGIAESAYPKRFKSPLRLFAYGYRELGFGCVVAKV